MNMVEAISVDLDDLVLPKEELTSVIQKVRGSKDVESEVVIYIAEAVLLQNHIYAFFYKTFFPNVEVDIPLSPESKAAEYFSENVVEALQTNGSSPSYAGIVNDIFGLFGHNPSHGYVAKSFGFQEIEEQKVEVIERFLIESGLTKEQVRESSRGFLKTTD